jgi:hypothetical protein
MRAHPAGRLERAPVVAGEAPVQLGLGLDLRLDFLRHRRGDQVEEHRSGFPKLGPDVQANFIDAPAALVEDPLGSGDGVGTVVNRQDPDG